MAVSPHAGGMAVHQADVPSAVPGSVRLCGNLFVYKHVMDACGELSMAGRYDERRSSGRRNAEKKI
ncbi:hypothetical protein, partial [Pseudomonas aeruginosa]|uniref:hypothetical protein n=1 Tax=Pseudomonas aeruginosa TaxID=287 RepID=UPI001ABCB3C2